MEPGNIDWRKLKGKREKVKPHEHQEILGLVF